MKISLYFLFTLISSCLINKSDNSGAGVGRVISSNSQSIDGIIDPETNLLVKKLTLSKNFSAGLRLVVKDIKNFKNQNILVDINFGHLEQFKKTLSATIESSSGNDYLFINLFGRDFQTMSLPYHLFDYSDYSSLLLSSPEIVQDNKSPNLYCRGLKLKDDPTSNGVSCDNASDTCLYAFANIQDKSLFNQGTNSYSIPTSAQFTPSSTVEVDEAKKCLNDRLTTLVSGESVSYNSSVVLNSSQYLFKGAFSAIDINNWEIKGNAIWSSKGIFASSGFGSLKDPSFGYFSQLFPIASKIKLNNALSYVGGNYPRGNRFVNLGLTDQGLIAGEETSQWMDGCNVRVLTRNTALDEDISSCNVSSIIEVYYFDENSEKVIIATSENENSKDIKIQLVNTSLLTQSSGGVCISDSGCGSDECCVDSQCVNQSSGQCNSTGGGLVLDGGSCSADYECASKCCKSGTCSPHGQGMFCNKQLNESCLSNDYCAIDNQLWATRIVQNVFSSDICSKKRCNVDRLQCINFTCVRNELLGGQGTANNPIDFHPDYEAGSCAGSVNEEVHWNCVDF